MTDASQLAQLKDRIDKAEGPNFELERVIHEVVLGQCTHRETRYYCIEDGNDSDSGHECIACGKDTYGERWPNYTASVDAALSLVEKCAPDAFWELDRGYNATITNADAGYCGAAHGKPTPALALLSALLSALLAMEERDG